MNPQSDTSLATVRDTAKTFVYEVPLPIHPRSVRPMTSYGAVDYSKKGTRGNVLYPRQNVDYWNPGQIYPKDREGTLR